MKRTDLSLARSVPPVTERVLLRTEIRLEQDVVLVRQRARQIAALLGFDSQDQTRIATAVSEIARNAYQYAGGGWVEFAVAPESGYMIVRVADRGPGILNVDEVLDGRYVSKTGMGLGIVGARRLTDRFEVASGAGAGTCVTLGKRLPRPSAPLSPVRLAEIAQGLTAELSRDPLMELQAQNQELLRTLQEVQARQSDIERLNAELEETNRGVLALYAELDDRAIDLTRASELKSQFLSNISHELRTPLNSILNLTRLLLDRLDGNLTAEQERQVTLVRHSASSLLDIVNDLLDLARIEAGKTVLRLGEFTIEEMLGALRAVLRPLVTSDGVALVVESPVGLGTMYSDEGKVSQILRNLVVNAIKFTEAGEIRIQAFSRGADTVVFAVADTGIGIAPEDQPRIFEEYGQVESALQRRATGSGLGLPLSRKLAQLLGGGLTVTSAVGVGSTFTLELPRVFGDVKPLASSADEAHYA